MRKEIALVDCNNFFVGCEQLMNPDLREKPVCVLGNNNGCVLARSNEAKKLGVTMGMPYFMAKKQFPNVIYLSSNMSLYHDVSLRLQKFLNNYSPSVEVYSIDEAFLDLSGLDKVFKMSYEELILKIKNDIQNEIGISVSVGLANSKVLAKVATDKAKMSDGIYRIKYENIRSDLKSLPIEKIWGIGKNTANELKKYGIFTALDIISHEDSFYKRTLGKRGLELKYELSGESVIKVLNDSVAPKSIQRTSSFPEFTSDKSYIKNSLYKHLHSVCRKMRNLNLAALTVVVMLRTKDFRVFTLKADLERPVNSEYFLNKKVDALLDKIYDPVIIYRSSGIFVERLEDCSNSQLLLFNSNDDLKADKISMVWDRIERKYGRNIFGVGLVHNHKKSR